MSFFLMYRLMRIEKEKAAERQRATLKQNADTDREMFPERETGRAKDKTAAAFGVSGETMRKEMQIVEKRDMTYQTPQKPCTAIILHRCIICIRNDQKPTQGQASGFFDCIVFEQVSRDSFLIFEQGKKKLS